MDYSTSLLGNRLKLATAAVRDARLEIETLKKEKDDLTKRLSTMGETTRSTIEIHRSKLEEARSQMRDVQSVFDGCLASLQSQFQNHSDAAKRAVDGIRYENKLLTDQLTVKKLKCTHLSKRVETQAKDIVRLKRGVAKMKARSGGLTMRCIRCKARKNVIKSLEQELVEVYGSKDAHESDLAKTRKEKFDLESLVETTKTDFAKLREEVVQLRRRNMALEQELLEEKQKGPHSDIDAGSGRTTVVEVARTPTDTQSYHSSDGSSSSCASVSFTSPAVHTRRDQFLAELRSQLEKKQTEINEAWRQGERLQAELAFYHQRCEDMTLDLENSTTERDQKQRELDAANQQVQLLQALLENLANGIVTAIAE